jgi:hypothetical protein
MITLCWVIRSYDLMIPGPENMLHSCEDRRKVLCGKDHVLCSRIVNPLYMLVPPVWAF